MLDLMHEGKKIKELLEQRGLKVQDLASACKQPDGSPVTWQAAKKYVTAEKLGAKARDSASKGLQVLGIDPRQIWPDEYLGKMTDIDRLRPLLKGFSLKQLADLKVILEADKATQIRLLDSIEGRIQLADNKP